MDKMSKLYERLIELEGESQFYSRMMDTYNDINDNGAFVRTCALKGQLQDIIFWLTGRHVSALGKKVYTIDYALGGALGRVIYSEEDV